PHPVMHHAGVPELAHAGIDDGIAGAPVLPRLQRPGVALPGEVVKGGLQVLLGEVRVVEQQVSAELAPAQFAQELLDAARQAAMFGGGEAGGGPALPRADLAKAQVRRQRRGAVAVGPVALARVALHAINEKGLEPGLRGLLAWRPGLAQAAGPVGMTRLERE